MKNTIIAHRADDSISLFINGEHFSHVYDSIEDAREDFKHIMSVKAHSTDEAVKELPLNSVLEFRAPPDKYLARLLRSLPLR